MLTIIIIYSILYLITTYLTWGAITDGKNDYPDYKNEPVTFWEYVIIYNPLNVIVGLCFVGWIIYDFNKDKKRDKRKKNKKIESSLEKDVNRHHDMFFGN